MRDRRVTREEAKKLEAATFLAEVRLALEDAHRTAAAAFELYLADLKERSMRDLHTFFDGGSGGAVVLVHQPSYRLRKALQHLDELDHWPHHGGWSVSNFSRHVSPIVGGSLTANKIACQAAAEVLQKHFTNDGEFFARGYGD